MVAREAGGITQRIGAYQVTVKLDGESRKITFLDTPGHEDPRPQPLEARRHGRRATTGSARSPGRLRKALAFAPSRPAEAGAGACVRPQTAVFAG